MAGVISIDVTPAAISAKHTGVERILRGLAAAGENWMPSWVVWDASRTRYRIPTIGECARVLDPFSGRKSGTAKPEGKTMAMLGRAIRLKWASWQQPNFDWSEPGWLILPFNFTDARNVWLRATPMGQRFAVLCHDVIPWEDALAGGIAHAATHPFAEYVTTLSKAAAVVCSTAHTEARLHEAWALLHLPKAPTRVLHLPIDTPPCATPLPQTEEPRVLFVSSVAPRKNHAGLLDAAQILWGRGLRFRLVLVGREGRGAESVAARISAMEKTHSVEWLRHVDETELAHQYATSYFQVFPSLQEGFGLPIQESLLHGRPVICAGFGAMAETAGLGGVQHADVANPESLADAMKRWLNDGDALERAATEAAARRFMTWPEYRAAFAAWLAECER